MFALLRNLAPYRGCPIAVDLGASQLRLAQVERLPSGDLRLIAAARCDVPADAFDSPRALAAFLPKALKQALARGGFRGHAAVLALPSPLAYIRHFRLPRLDDEQTRQHLQGEVAGKLPLEPSQCVLRHVIAGEVYGDGGGAQNEAILFASSQQAVQALLDAAISARLEVTGLQAGPRAIVDCFSHVYRRRVDADAVDLLLDLGASSTRVLVARDRAIRFARSIPLASAALTEEASVMRLVDEVEMCRRYYEATFSDKPVSRLLFVGGGARDANRCQSIAQMIGLPAQVGDPLVRFKTDELPDPTAIDRRQPNPDWAVAIGLSLGPATAATASGSPAGPIHGEAA